MSKFPMLEQMRAERQRREDEITAPYRDEINGFHRLVSRLRETIRGIERTLGSEVGKHLADQVGREMSRLVRTAIYEAAAKTRTADEPVTVTLSAEAIRFMNPSSLESEILSRYAHTAIPDLRLGVDVKPDDCVTVVDIRIPEMGYRHVQYL